MQQKEKPASGLNEERRERSRVRPLLYVHTVVNLCLRKDTTLRLLRCKTTIYATLVGMTR